MENYQEMRDEKNLNIIRSMIDNESTLKNNRITWMSASQALLLAAVGTLWGESFYAIAVLGLLGFLVVISIWYSLRISCRAVADLRDKGEQIREEHPNLPPVIGYWSSKYLRWLLPWDFLPFWFTILWPVLVCIAYYQQSSWPLCP